MDAEKQTVGMGREEVGGWVSGYYGGHIAHGALGVVQKQ